MKSETRSKQDRINDMLNMQTRMSQWKKPQPLDFVSKSTKNYNFVNWQTGNDESVYYNLNIPSFFKTRVVMPPAQTSILERDLNPDLLDISFNNLDSSANPTLEEYIKGPKQVQAMMMAHKGKVVFETYPGMNATDLHVWMSASKTTVSLLVTMLWEEGKLDFEKPISDYLPELKGSAWDGISVKNAMNMSVGLDLEETFENLVNPNSSITRFFTAVFDAKGDWRQLLHDVKPLPGEKPGDIFRYSSAITMALVLLTQNISGKPWQAMWGERVWSKIGARNPFIIGLAPEGTPVAAGLNNTTIEDMLRYAMVYTPSWNKVAAEKVVSEKALQEMQTLGNHAAYHKSTEEGYGSRWFGEVPYMNSAQWDHCFEDGAMFKHGNMGQGIYVDPFRDFCGCYFGLATNDESISGVDHSPGYLRTAAKLLAGG